MSNQNLLKTDVIEGMTDAVVSSFEAMIHAGERLEFKPTFGDEAVVATLEPTNMAVGAYFRVFLSDDGGGTVGPALISALIDPQNRSSCRDIYRAVIVAAAHSLIARIPIRRRVSLSLMEKADRVAELRTSGKDTPEYLQARQDLVAAVDALSARV